MHIRPKLQALFNPEQFHGWGKNKRYFEGWYYKLVSADEASAYAFIPGIAMDEQGNKQAFIQVLDGKNLTAQYFKFKAEAFVPSAGVFELAIERNYFDAHSIELDLPDLVGSLNFSNLVPWSSTWYSPGIMGPFTFVPFMQCYHGILSMDHTISGALTISGKKVDFTGGRGYMEKDWGRSFPKGYIWMQSNHFSNPGISLKASVAKIPWVGSSFIGFIAGVWLYDTLIEFTTYNFTKLRQVSVDAAQVHIIMENNKHRLELIAHKSDTTSLASPILGFMSGRIEESMTSKIDVVLYDKRSRKILLEDTGRNAGLEVAGKYEEILV